MAQASASETFPSPVDVTDTLNYPLNPPGGTITYLEILIEQSPNTYTKTIVTGGGLGQRTLNLTIQAFATSLFAQRTRIYGFP